MECLSETAVLILQDMSFGKSSRAIYFKDPDGIILEAIQDTGE